jgi:hypothetical protein
VNVTPWELNPALAQERLVALARVAVATRNRAFAEADRAAGDTNWGLACKAHERLMHALGGLDAGGEHPWLTVIRDGLYLMPLVDGVPVRLYRGAADRPSARHLDAVRMEHERSQPARPQMAFDFMGGAGADDGGPWYWLMAMETDAAGMVSRVVYFQANDAGETRHPWECALESPKQEAPVQVQQVLAQPQPQVHVQPQVQAQPQAQAQMLFEQEEPRAPAAVPRPAGEDAARRRGRRVARPLQAAESRQAALWGAIGAE